MMAPLQCRIEAVKGAGDGMVRAVLIDGGRVVNTRDVYVAAGHISSQADYLALFIQDNNQLRRAVEFAADWPAYGVGAYTMRARLQCILRGFLERPVA